MSEFHVKMAQLKTGKTGDILKATLGSCLGIIFIWKEEDLCGLAHCLLPETETITGEISAKFVNQAIASLMKIMNISKGNIPDIEVYLAGGGNMMSQLLKSKNSQVGVANIDAAHKYLSQYGFKIKKEVLGHNCGSEVVIDCTLKSVEFKLLENLNVA